MRAKLMTSAAALAGALAFAGMAQAQSSSGPNGAVGGNTTATDSYNSGGNSTDVDLGVADSFNTDNSLALGVSDSLNDNSNNSTNTDLDLGVADSFNDNSNNSDNSDNSTNTNLELGVADSFNDNSNNSTNTDLDVGVTDSFNDNSDNSTNTEVGISDSFNTDASTNTDNSVNTNLELGVDIADSFNDNSVNDSGNDNSTNIGNIRVSLNMQELSANVSNLSFDMSEEGRGPQNGRIRTGDINQNGGAFAGFAGIQTVSNNTGLASVGQAATAVSANANVTFGGGGN